MTLPIVDRISLSANAVGSPSDDGLVLLANKSMRARQRPRMIAVTWLWYAVCGFVLAWPSSRLVAEAYGTHPNGDATVFRPGGLELFDLLLHSQRAFATFRAHVLLFLPLVLVLGLLPLAALMTAMAYATRERRAPRMRQLVARAATAFKPMLLLLVIATVLEAILFAIGLGVGTWSSSGLSSTLGDARADQIGFLVTGLFLVLVMTVGVLHDLARAAVVRFQVSGRRALVLGFNAFRRHPLVSLWSWAWRAAAGIVPVVAGSVVAERLGGRSGVGFVLLVLMHQLVIVARVALRASWLSKAIRAVDHAHRVVRSGRSSAPPPPPLLPPLAAISPAARETAARNDAPVVPILDRGA